MFKFWFLKRTKNRHNICLEASMKENLMYLLEILDVKKHGNLQKNCMSHILTTLSTLLKLFPITTYQQFALWFCFCFRQSALFAYTLRLDLASGYLAFVITLSAKAYIPPLG